MALLDAWALAKACAEADSVDQGVASARSPCAAATCGSTRR